MLLFQQTSVRQTPQKRCAWLLSISYCGSFRILYFWVIFLMLLSLHRFLGAFSFAFCIWFQVCYQRHTLANASILILSPSICSLDALIGLLLHLHLADAWQQRAAGLDVPCISHLVGGWLLQLLDNILLMCALGEYFDFTCLQLEGGELRCFHWLCMWIYYH